jgi:hypothetical protein
MNIKAEKGKGALPPPTTIARTRDRCRGRYSRHLSWVRAIVVGRRATPFRTPQPFARCPDQLFTERTQPGSPRPVLFGRPQKNLIVGYVAGMSLLVGLIVALAALVVILLLVNGGRAKTINKVGEVAKDAAKRVEGFSSMPAPLEGVGQVVQLSGDPAVHGGVMPSDPHGNETFSAIEASAERASSQLADTVFPKDRAAAADLLPPGSSDSRWSAVNPKGDGALGDRNFLTAGFNVGVDTVGSSLRNANQQLRSDPVIPKATFPWQNSTIEPDTARRRLDIL